MLAPERRQRLLELMTASGSARTADLARALDVSQVTIRADLSYFERQGKVRRTHGGAVCAAPGDLSASFSSRAHRHADAKRRIAAAAQGLITPGEVVIIDAGTTAYSLAQLIGPGLGLTVFTPGINVAQQLAGLEGTAVHVLGGLLQPESLETIGSAQEQGLTGVLAHTVFLGAGGIDADLDVTESSYALAVSKRNMAAAARRKVLLVDSSKWASTAAIKAMPLTTFDLIITDTNLPAAADQQLRERGLHVTRV